MLKENYYYLVAGLPELIFGENTRVGSSLAFMNKIKGQVNSDDFKLIELLYLANDNKHILNFHLEKEKLVDGGVTPTVPSLRYMISFVEWAEDKDPKEMKLRFANKLYSLYYEYVLTTQNTFLKEWFTLELNIKNILTAFNCIEFDYPIESHLIKTQQGNTVYSLLRNNHFKHEFFEDEVPYARQIFAIAKSKSSPETKEKGIDQLLWNYLDDQTSYHYFSIEKIISYN